MTDSSRVSVITRPRSISILVFLLILQSFILLAYGAFTGITSGWALPIFSGQAEEILLWINQISVSGPAMIVQGLLLFLSGLGLLRLQGWAWLLAMAVEGFELLIALFAYYHQAPNYIAMVVGIIMVFYLNQMEVQTAVLGKRDVNR